VVDQKWGKDRVWHNGGINGFTASFQRYPTAHVTAVALNNQQSPATDKVAADLAGLCLGADVYPKEVAETPANLQRYAGYYQAGPLVVRLEPRGGALIAHLAGNPDTSYYPEGAGRFFARTSDAAITFQTGADGQVTGALVAQGQGPAPPISARRIDAAEADRLIKAAALRAQAKTPAPGAEEALRRVIAELQKGEPDYSRMGPQLAAATRQQLPAIKAGLEALGQVKSISFQSAGPGGVDIFTVTFEKGADTWRIAVGDNGRIDGLSLSPPS
jgi:hypothetical protein